MMDSGSLVEEGTHQELIQQQGRYFALYFTAGGGPPLIYSSPSQSLCLPRSRLGKGVQLMEQGATGRLFDLVECRPLWWHPDLAFTAKIDQTVTVRGRLEPSGSVRDVESPSAGVVSKVFVKDGEVVKQGQPLFDVEAKGLSSRRKALERTLALYELQASTLTSILRSGGDPSLRPAP